MIYIEDRDKLLAAAGRNVTEERYWLGQLRDLPQKAVFPPNMDSSGPAAMEVVPLAIGGTLAQGLWKLRNGKDPVLHMALLAGVAALVTRYTGQDDIVLGMPIYRQQEQGNFINTALPIRLRLNGQTSFKQLLLEVRRVVGEAVRHQNYPHRILIEKLGLGGGNSGNGCPLFDITVSLDPLHDPAYIEGIDTRINILFRLNEQKLEGVITLDLNRYPHPYGERLGAHLCHLLESAVFSLDSPIAELEMLFPDEKTFIKENLLQSTASISRAVTVHRWIETMSAQRPDATALVCGESMLTYHELNRRADRLASDLQLRQVIPGAIVGIMMEPSLAAIEGILGILKAGAAYLPVDPNYPMNRITGMLDDAAVEVLVTGGAAVQQRSFTRLKALAPASQGIVKTATRPPMCELDKLGIPDRSLVSYDRYLPHIGQAMVRGSIALQATRGCPYNCAYCHKIWPKGHEVRSARHLFDELHMYYRMGIRRFVILDDIFNLNIKNSSAFFQLIIEHELDVQLFFPNGLRGDILTRDYIDLMVRAGTVNVAIALETASPRLQELVQKKLDLEKLKETLEYFCRHYPHVIIEVFTMHGFPSETEAEARLTLDFLKDLHWIHFPYFHILKIYPNTGMERLALACGVDSEAIAQSADLAYHELPETLPFHHSFTRNLQAEFLNDYFLSKQRLLALLPLQLQVLDRRELVEKYDSYLPATIRSIEYVLRLADIPQEEWPEEVFAEQPPREPVYLDHMIQEQFPANVSDTDALRVLLLDVSQFFSGSSESMLYDVVEPPLGLMYLQTYVNRRFGSRVSGKIAKSRIDFDSFSELKRLILEFKPQLIGIRTLTFYRDFFHEAVARIRSWRPDVPIVAGGPYATSDYLSILQDENVDLAVLGEGEETFGQLLEAVIECQGTLPPANILANIAGIVFRGDPGFRRSRRVVLWDEQGFGCGGEDEEPALPVASDAHDLAYIIYTSGSTGKPKGAMVEHRNLAHLLEGALKMFDFGAADVWTLFHSYCFDFSVWEIFGSLVSGGRLVIVPRAMARDSRGVLDELKKKAVTVLNQVPSAFYNLAREEAALDTTDLAVRSVIFGGEALLPAKLAPWREKYPDTRLANMFGITETTIHVTFQEIAEQEIEKRKSDIGKPLPGYPAFVMTSQQTIAPVGIPGEFWVGGDGVCRGYLNNVSLTEEKFVSIAVEGETHRLYRSGDLVRLLDNGRLEYLGRIDHQVKIRGYRIELGEIEAQLARYPVIREAVALPVSRQDDDPVLCAYLVLKEEGSAPEDRDLREFLARRLPSYMIPAFFVPIDAIPLTANGKIDKAALPVPLAGGSRKRQAPQNPFQETLTRIWASVLAVPEDAIDIDDNFFEIGGHSLKATLLVAKMRKELHADFPVREIFNHPTIRGFEAFAQKHVVIDWLPPIESSDVRDHYPQSSAQKRLFFLGQFDNIGTSYNIPAAFKIEGRLDSYRFRAALDELVRRHEVLRTSFRLQDSEPVQIVHPAIAIEAESISLREWALDQVMVAFVRPFDLESPPLIRVCLVDGGENVQYLLFDIHHIISDGVSMSVLIRDFIALYSGKALKPLNIQYRDFALWQQDLVHSGVIAKQESYWLELYGDLNSMSRLRLPYDFPMPDYMDFAGDLYEFKLDADVTRRFQALERRLDVTLFMNLLAAFNVLLHHYSGQDDIIVGTAVAGRRHVDLQDIIGFFVNSLAMRNAPSPQKKFSDFVAEVKETTLQAFDNQDVQFEDLVFKLNPSRDAGRNPLFDVAFGLQNFDDPEADRSSLDGLNISLLNMQRNYTTFNLVLYASVKEDCLHFKFNYATALFKRSTIETLSGHLLEVIGQAAKDPDTTIKNFHLSHNFDDAAAQSDFGDLDDFKI